MRSWSDLREPGEKLRHGLENWTNFLILPLFAFFNTGLVLTGSGFDPDGSDLARDRAGVGGGQTRRHRGGDLDRAAHGVATKSDDIGWRHLIGAGCLCGIGFTMSIFISGAAFAGPALDQAKISVLLASVLAAVIGMLVLRGAKPPQRSSAR